jgi:hypothetical protein
LGEVDCSANALRDPDKAIRSHPLRESVVQVVRLSMKSFRGVREVKVDFASDAVLVDRLYRSNYPCSRGNMERKSSCSENVGRIVIYIL